jgi:hypothetical protein
MYLDDSKFHEYVCFHVEQKFTNTAKNLIIYFEILMERGIITKEEFTDIKRRIFDYTKNGQREMIEILNKLEIGLKS